MEELRPGLWYWTAPHPEWTPDQGGPTGWEREVGCYALDGDALRVLIDPMSPPEELTSDKEIAVLLTCHWHERSAKELDAPIYAPDEIGTRYAAGDTLPGGIVAYETRDPLDLALWLPEHRAVVFGDVIVSRERGLDAESWLSKEKGETLELVREKLGPLLELPIELVLPTHGEPVVEGAHGALRRALGA